MDWDTVKPYVGSLVRQMDWDTVKPYVGSLVRHGLTGLAVYLATKGVGLDDATVDDLTVVAVAGIGMGWSWLEKARRPS